MAGFSGRLKNARCRRRLQRARRQFIKGRQGRFPLGRAALGILAGISLLSAAVSWKKSEKEAAPGTDWVSTRQRLEPEAGNSKETGFHVRLDERGITFFHIQEETYEAPSD
jgi:hypothetical protein